MASKFRKIMREATASDDQYAFVTQRFQRSPDTKMVLGTEMRLHREPEYRNVGLWIRRQQRYPGAVIQAAPSIGMQLKPPEYSIVATRAAGVGEPGAG